MLIVGFLIVDFIGDLVQSLLISIGVDEKFERTSSGSSLKNSGLTASGIISGLIKLFGYLMFLTIASNILQLSMIIQLLIDITLYLPRLITGILILMIGILSIDIVGLPGRHCKRHEHRRNRYHHSSSERFMFLIVILVALDTMLVNTGFSICFSGRWRGELQLWSHSSTELKTQLLRMKEKGSNTFLIFIFGKTNF